MPYSFLPIVGNVDEKRWCVMVLNLLESKSSIITKHDNNYNNPGDILSGTRVYRGCWPCLCLLQ